MLARSRASLFLLLALGAVPARAQVPSAAADSLYRAARWSEAASAYEALVARANGRAPRAAYRAAASYARLGRVDTAFAWLRQVTSLGMLSPDSLRRDADLTSLRKDARFAAALDSARVSWEPCAADANARRFDFWIGEWRVHNTLGQAVGESSIQRISGGCAILENWTSSTGVAGKSLNFYNHDSAQWQQYWVGQQGDQVQFTTSTWDGPTLRFRGESTQRGGARVTQRLSFTPIARDTVRQLGETSSDGGGTWTTAYDLYYVRKP